MDLGSLEKSARIGGSLLQVPGATPLILVERISEHGWPLVAVLGRHESDLSGPLGAIGDLQAQGLPLNLAGLLPLDSDGAPFLEPYRTRIGSLVCAIDAGIPWPEGQPIVPRRLPGRLRAPHPVPLGRARLSPLEAGQLKDLLPEWSRQHIEEVFESPPWIPSKDGFEAPWWPGVVLPSGVQVLWDPLELPTAAPVQERARAVLRGQGGRPVPVLPLDADPRPLQALGMLSPDLAVFRGPVEAWKDLFLRLATLPAPPHFCARC
ncbi:MAG: hypothetical protein HY823_14865 [Acidobacteria bacterium]|nr:hypothetical protein [Acidobacteriota bacterium]